MTMRLPQTTPPRGASAVAFALTTPHASGQVQGGGWAQLVAERR